MSPRHTHTRPLLPALALYLAIGCAHATEAAPPATGSPSDAVEPGPAVEPAVEPAAPAPVALRPFDPAAFVGPPVPVEDDAWLNDDDRYAGLITRDFPMKGRGRLVVVRGRQEAPEGEGRVRTVRVEVEAGLRIDRRKFAAFVLETLNDPRSWRHKSGERFARTDDKKQTDFRVVLASPETSARLCRPMTTDGVLSCRKGNAAYLTMFRWVNATPDYQADRNGYRRYLVNHEVGHALGRKHARCIEPGWLAPVMLQQTISLAGCLPNSWPYPMALGVPADPQSPQRVAPSDDVAPPDKGKGTAAPIVPDDLPSDAAKNTSGG
jgi:hypothetical protein